MELDALLDKAVALDAAKDDLYQSRHLFALPRREDGLPYIYFCGNSLGAMPLSTPSLIVEECDDWAKLGVEGHLHAKRPWLPYHELLTDMMARVVGAKPAEVVMMNTLSVNLHLMMVSFYRPTSTRHKIIIESDAFPSDLYAVETQIRHHQLDPNVSLIKLTSRPGEDLLREEDILAAIKLHGEETALILLGVTNYYTGQLFPMKNIVEKGHSYGCLVGFDCAHGVGNVELNLHDCGPDFAVWCTYKYLNSGPGAVAGCFIHERHIADKDILRFGGWWGHDKASRFKMRGDFDPIQTAEGWQLSNPPIMALAPVLSSLRIFEQVGMDNIRKMGMSMSQFLLECLLSLNHPDISIITPADPDQRGCQLSIQIRRIGKNIFDQLQSNGIIADWRHPDVIRVAPTPLYNTYQEIHSFVKVLSNLLSHAK